MDRHIYLSSLPYIDFLPISTPLASSTKYEAHELLPDNSMGLSIEPLTYQTCDASNSTKYREIDYLSNCLPEETWIRQKVDKRVLPAFFRVNKVSGDPQSTSASPLSTHTTLSDPAVTKFSLTLLTSPSGSFPPTLTMTTNQNQTYRLDHTQMSMCRIEKEVQSVGGEICPPSLIFKFPGVTMRVYEVDESVRVPDNTSRFSYSVELLKKAYMKMRNLLKDEKVCTVDILLDAIGRDDNLISSSVRDAGDSSFDSTNGQKENYSRVKGLSASQSTSPSPSGSSGAKPATTTSARTAITQTTANRRPLFNLEDDSNIAKAISVIPDATRNHVLRFGQSQHAIMEIGDLVRKNGSTGEALSQAMNEAFANTAAIRVDQLDIQQDLAELKRRKKEVDDKFEQIFSATFPEKKRGKKRKKSGGTGGIEDNIAGPGGGDQNELLRLLEERIAYDVGKSLLGMLENAG